MLRCAIAKIYIRCSSHLYIMHIHGFRGGHIFVVVAPAAAIAIHGRWLCSSLSLSLSYELCIAYLLFGGRYVDNSRMEKNVLRILAHAYSCLFQ